MSMSKPPTFKSFFKDIASAVGVADNLHSLRWGVGEGVETEKIRINI